MRNPLLDTAFIEEGRPHTSIISHILLPNKRTPPIINTVPPAATPANDPDTVPTTKNPIIESSASATLSTASRVALPATILPISIALTMIPD